MQQFGRNLLSLNLFKEEMTVSRQPDAQRIGLLSTRMYIVSLVFAMLALSLFNGLGKTNFIQSEKILSIAHFEELYERHPTTISCPCQQIAIPRSTFVFLTPKHHQVRFTQNFNHFLSHVILLIQICSSELVNTTWIVSLYGYGSSAKNYNQLDRPLLSKYFQIIKQFCEQAKETYVSMAPSFTKRTFVTTSVIPRYSFETQVRAMINDFITILPMDTERLTEFYSSMIIYNLLPSAFNNDWSLEFGNASNDYMIRHIPRLYDNGSCNCLISKKCQRPLLIGPSDVTLPGLVTGCTPLDGLRMSTFECFYSSSCIATIISYLNYFTELNGSAPVNFNTSVPTSDMMVTALDESNLVLFTKNMTVGKIMDELFIDGWNMSSSYEQYYNACAPTTCQYEYIARNSPIYIVTLLLSLHGGLTIGLRVLMWNAAKFYQTCRYRLIRQNTVVQPFTMNI